MKPVTAKLPATARRLATEVARATSETLTTIIFKIAIIWFKWRKYRI
jgi:hypothetical protein